MRYFQVTATYTPNDRSDDRDRETRTFHSDAVKPLDMAIAALEHYGAGPISEVLERDDIASQLEGFGDAPQCIEFVTFTNNGELHYDVEIRDPSEEKKTRQLAALRRLDAALEESTECGLLTEIAEQCADPDLIDGFCDAVTEYAKISQQS